ncbi:MAG: CapA family protein [Syntrophomonas sp.]
MRRKLIIGSIIAVIALVCGFYYVDLKYKEASVPSATQNQAPGQPGQDSTITLVAAGDCLMHNTQIWSGQKKDGSYSFDPFFTEVKDLINEGDYSSTNFEAPMAGPARGYLGYPLFNSPDAAATTFKEAGFDLMVTANNHIMDQGIQGALRTMQVLHNAGLDTVGTRENPEESRWLIKDVNGVKVGYLAYSYSTNGIAIPKGYEYFYNFLNKDQIMEDIKTVRPQVDVLILVLHWGVEYNPKPTAEQRAMARQFLEAGADAILGSHPHVIQTMEVLQVGGQDKFVIYGMGNFISDQNGQDRNSGIVLKLKFHKDAIQGKTLLQEVSYTPTYSHHYKVGGATRFRVVPVEETIAKIKNGQEKVFSTRDLPLLQAVLADTKSRLGPGFKAAQ